MEKIIAVPNGYRLHGKHPGFTNKTEGHGLLYHQPERPEKQGSVYADVKSITLEGPATKDIQFNPKPWRRSASVHLGYTVPDDKKVEWFYGEINVPEGQDKLGTYFYVLRISPRLFWNAGERPAGRRIIFSVWDSGKEPDNRDKVKYEDQVTLTAKGDSVVASGFGGEGTGGHSHWVYNWKAGET